MLDREKGLEWIEKDSWITEVEADFAYDVSVSVVDAEELRRLITNGDFDVKEEK